MVSSRARVSEDTAIGVFMATGMALGIMLLTLSKGYARDLYGYLFGNILAVTWNDVLIILALTLIILVLVFLLYKEFLVLSFDPIYGEAIGLPVQSLRLLLLGMVAFSVVVLIKIVGIIMVIALLDNSWGHKPAAHEGTACHHGRFGIPWQHLCNHRPIYLLLAGRSLWSNHNPDCGCDLLPEHSPHQIGLING